MPSRMSSAVERDERQRCDSIALRVMLLMLSPIMGTLVLPDTRAWADEPNAELPTVMVTANRREEDVQQVPIAISVLSSELAAHMGITDPQSLAGAVPGLNFNRAANLSIPFLRGVGSPVGESGDEPSVAMYVDDVYLPAGAASLANFNSLERIEVEKGPQGTVFGRNATGGVVQVYTRNPSAEPGLDVTAGYANYDTKSGSLYATGGLSNILAANIALYGMQQIDGWGHYVLTNAPAFTGWEYGGRIKLLWTPTGKTSVLLATDYDDLRSEEGLDFRAFPGTGSLNPIPPFPNGGFSAPGGYYDNYQNVDSYTITRQSGVSLKVTSDFDWTRFVSITAWRFTKAVDPLDEDVGPLPLVNALVTTREHTWTQEIRFASPAGSRTEWIFGAFYFDDIAGYMPLNLNGLAFAPLPFVDTFSTETTSSWAGFVQATRHILPATNLTLGVRYTTDHRRLDASAQYGDGPQIPASNSPRAATWSKLTDRVIVDHHFAEDVMAYVGYNRGFKSGLFNPIVAAGAPIGAPVAPEVLDSYTVGEKAEFLAHRLRINTEAFYYKYRNIQVNEIVTGSTYITNAAKATIKGVDVDVTMIPVAGLTITASIEALTGRYDSFPNGQFQVYNPITGGNCLFTSAGSCPAAVLPPNYDAATRTWDLKGDHTVQTPPFSSNFMISYKILSSAGELDLSANWTHTGNYYADADNGLGQVAPSSSNNDKQGLVDILNTSIGWTSNDNGWQARVWGKNLTGMKYWSFAIETPFATQYTAAPPRTLGVTVSKRW
jgi:iron complex outermembrane recepter protein